MSIYGKRTTQLFRRYHDLARAETLTTPSGMVLRHDGLSWKRVDPEAEYSDLDRKDRA